MAVSFGYSSRRSNPHSPVQNILQRGRVRLRAVNSRTSSVDSSPVGQRSRMTYHLVIRSSSERRQIAERLLYSRENKDREIATRANQFQSEGVEERGKERKKERKYRSCVTIKASDKSAAIKRRGKRRERKKRAEGSPEKRKTRRSRAKVSKNARSSRPILSRISNANVVVCTYSLARARARLSESLIRESSTGTELSFESKFGLFITSERSIGGTAVVVEVALPRAHILRQWRMINRPKGYFSLRIARVS